MDAPYVFVVAQPSGLAIRKSNLPIDAHRRVDDDARSHTRAKDLPHNNLAGSMQVHVAGEPGDSGDKMKGHLVHVEAMRFRAQVEGAPEILFDAGDQRSRPWPCPIQATLFAMTAFRSSGS